MERNARFEELAAPDGGAIPPVTLSDSPLMDNPMSELEALHKDTQPWINQHFHMYFPSMPDVYFGWVNNSELNAFAWEEQGQAYVGMNYGTMYVLRYLFGRLMADPNIMPHLGNVAVEDPNIPPLIVSDNLMEIQAVTSRYIEPKDPKRQHFASFMASAANMFLVAHELAHITGGHTVLTGGASTSHLTAVRKLYGAYSSSADFGIDRAVSEQCLEMDADSEATKLCLGDFLYGQLRNPQSRFPQIADVYENEREIFQAWVFAIGLMWACSEFALLDKKAITSAIHLYSPFRFKMILNSGMQTLEKFGAEYGDPEIGERFAAATNEIMPHFLQAFQIASIDNYKVSLEEGWQSTFEDFVTKHLRELLYYWDETLKGDLEKYARRPLAVASISGSNS